jgi:hypothetical protein
MMSRILIALGLILVAIGLLWRWIERLGLGRLPGDLVIEHKKFAFYFPFNTGLLISAALTLMFLARQPVIIGGPGRRRRLPQT